MNIIEVMKLPIGSKVTNSKGTEYIIKGIGYCDKNDKNLVNVKSRKVAQINKNMVEEEYSIVKKFKKGDKVYIDWFLDTEGLDEVEFLRYCPGGIFAQVLIETGEKYLLKEVEVKNIFEHK